MSTATATRAKAPVSNRIGLGLEPYRGLKTTLCAGCGHNSISERIIECFFEMGIDPTQVIKLSGIGCSSKSPAYFLSMSHGFNSVHGRMPAVATGAVWQPGTAWRCGSPATATRLRFGSAVTCT